MTRATQAEVAPKQPSNPSLWRPWALLRWLLAAIGLVAVLSLIWLLYAWAGSDALDVRFAIDARHPERGRLLVRLELEAIDKPVVFLRATTSEEEMRLGRFSARGEDGERLPHGTLGALRFVWVGFRDRARLDYSVWPGVLGRHGHQGIVGEHFALLPGRSIFLRPARGALFRSALVRFDLPSGWEAAHPFREAEEDWASASALGEVPLDEVLAQSTIGLGRWSRDRREVKGQSFEVYTFSGWSEDYRRRLSDRAHAVLQLFQELSGLERSHPFVVVFTPRARDRRGVIAGYWSTGLGHDMDDSPRAWSLFAHRLAHVLNRDRPYGVRLDRDPRFLEEPTPVNWIAEGMAGFLELWAVEAAGIASLEELLDPVWKAYLGRRRSADAPDVPLAREHTTKNESVIEYLHYTKAPLFMAALDHWLRHQSKGQKTLLEFFRRSYRELRGGSRLLPFVPELSRYAGFGVDSFFTEYALEDRTLVPTWPSFYRRYGEQPVHVVARVDGRDVAADRELLTRAFSFEGARAHSERLALEALTADALFAREPAHFLREMFEQRTVVPARSRELLARAMGDALFGAGGSDQERRSRVGSGHDIELVPEAVARFAAYAEEPLPQEDRARALTLARAAIEQYRSARSLMGPDHRQDELSLRLRSRGDVFVTLWLDGQQRGCVGTVGTETPLFRAIAASAVKAAFFDDRYAPVGPEEMTRVRIEISLLDRWQSLARPEELELGKHGLTLEVGEGRALFLPRVPGENGWDREETLQALSRKAGLPADAWMRPTASLQTFEAESFGE